jgi:hypothetical protein
MITIMSSLSNALYINICIYMWDKKEMLWIRSQYHAKEREEARERERERGRERKPHAACRRNRDRPDEWRNETKRKHTPRSYTVAIERPIERHDCVNNTRLYIHTHPLSTRQAIELRMLLCYAFLFLTPVHRSPSSAHQQQCCTCLAVLPVVTCTDKIIVQGTRRAAISVEMMIYAIHRQPLQR